MKLLIKPLFIVFFSALFLLACSDQTVPQEGQQYTAIAKPLEDKTLAPVSEVFSLTCGHCRNMEHFLGQISEEAGTDIGKMHITFNDSAQAAALIYYAAEMQLGTTPDSAFMDELFAAVQMPSDSSETEKTQAIKNVFKARELISPDQLSQQQNDDLRHKVANIERLSTQSGINAVPTFIVNGRYQVIVGGHKTPKQIANTIRYLLKK
ncbi:MAG: protein-disulfide isomerase [Psychromonas sp.]|jgi:protein-disulfide isomerase|uniref:thiol:disulfide interchange protein DsbA/DsbL n=1 Tax=Psychromonas sp. TaxID=1884585 RepID=UPI0039E6EFD4